MEKVIQSYEVVKQIGAGGMATVFMGRHPTLDRLVAIKVVKGDNKDKIKRFEREAILSASLKQENLPSIYDYFMDAQKNHYLVMEYVEGIDVSEILKSRGPLPPGICAMIIREAARGLEHMHENGIIHRDIKPSNVRLGNDGQVKLMDFGIAKQEDDDAHRNLTSTGIIVGTPSYMSPEQASGDKLTVQSDIFSLGTMMYELLSGKKPFAADSNLTLITLIAQGKFESLYHINAQLPHALVEIVHKAMSKNLHNRYQLIGHLIKDLNNFLQAISQSQIKDYLTKYYGAVTSKDKKIDLAKFDIPVNADFTSTAVDLSYSSLSFTSYFKHIRKFRWFYTSSAAFVLAVFLLIFLYANEMIFQEPPFGKVEIGLKSKRQNILRDTKLYINDREYALGDAFNGSVSLNKFQYGKNTIRFKFPVMYSTQEFHFTLKEETDSLNFNFDVDKAIDDMDIYAPENKKIGVNVSSIPQGAAVYVNNDLKGTSLRTPYSQNWGSFRTPVQSFILKKENFLTMKILGPFPSNESFGLHVYLEPNKK
ncbi:serine/threonine protein kinase [bacterium]|nr:MAG: serine/threonine protein kinase [bacterium]